ncbi:MAG: esterase family protein [Balneolaceae bacterium]|nr:esterase family protein [Balneolaceae bacterium]
MRFINLLFLSAFLLHCSGASINNVDEVNKRLDQIEQAENAENAQQLADELWQELAVADQIPFTSDSTVIFLYKGDAESVRWNGDFNSWGGNKSIQIIGERVGESDLWTASTTFPTDARLDYKITVNETDWMLDPANPNQQWSGFGPNSELRMPEWKPEPLTYRSPDTDNGLLRESTIIESSNLGYEVSYQVYLPDGYETTEQLPVIYVTDGQEYSDDNLGAMVVVLDNLIHQKKIEPVITVFVNPLDPSDPDLNRRMDEMGNNEDYLNFFVDELIPTIENEYKASPVKSDRAILGTSLGGLNATYFAFSRPDLFGNAAIQAPAFWYREEIYDLVKEIEVDELNIYISVGTIGDNTIDARTMKTIFEEKGLDFTYLEVNEGHSWGAWRTQLDDILLQFFGD